MSLVVSGVAALMALAAPAVVLVAVALGLGRRPSPAPSGAAAAAERHGSLVAALAWLLAIATPVAAGFLMTPAVRASGGSPLAVGVLTGLLPALAGLCFLGVHAVGERTWPRPTGPVRRAALVARSSTAPAGIRRLAWAWTGGLLLLLTATGVTASDGRVLSRAVDASTTTAASPYPGAFYGIPLALGAAAVLGCAELVLRLVARRPAVVDADPAWDAASRRLSAHRALRGTQLVLALTLAATLAVTGNAAHVVGYSGMGAAAAVAGIAVGVVALGAAAVPARAPGAAADTTLPAAVRA